MWRACRAVNLREMTWVQQQSSDARPFAYQTRLQRARDRQMPLHFSTLGRGNSFPLDRTTTTFVLV
jgi:hypothetical protein